MLRNMDSRSSDDRQEEIQVCQSDNVENVNEPMEENVPKILSTEIYDAFHIFASMLDPKSFMKLALTSKDMYKRCIENKAIKINVDVNELEVKKENGTLVTRWPYYFDDAYVAALRGLSCKLNVRVLLLHYITEEIGVYRIYELHIDHELDEVETIVKDFGVKYVNINRPIPIDSLRSFLQLNLEKLSYCGAVPVDFILEIYSTIREICFARVGRISREHIMHISWKIQSGSLCRLSVNDDAIDWSEFDMLPLDHDGPFPDDRPLMLTKEPYSDENDSCECWILYSNGGITKCAANDRLDLEFYKCEEWEYPWILRKEEDIFTDIAEKRPKVSCTFDHFCTFSANFTMIDRSHKGSLPGIRPLYCKVSDSHFWLLDDEDNLMECSWYDGYAVWTSFDPQYLKLINHPALAKYTFWKVVKQVVAGQHLYVDCEGLNEFDSWFDEFNKLDFEYSGSSPKTRPLVFKRAPHDFSGSFLHWYPCQDKHLHVVVLEDRLVECTCKSHRYAEIKLCSFSHRPPSLFTAENVPEMLKFWEKKKISPVRFRVMISERAAKELWFIVDREVRKVKLESGLHPTCADLYEAPPNFMKQAFRYLVETEPSREYDEYTFLRLHQFHSCLEQFTVLPFDYSGSLTSDSPLAFMKKKISHSYKCSKESAACGCTDYTILVWFLWNAMKVTYCSCGKGDDPRIVEFGKSADFSDMPPALKSKEYLKNLLQGEYDESSSYDWFGHFNDFLACLNEYVKLSFNYDARLPHERPLVFDSRSDEKDLVYFILREDGTVIECKKNSASHISVSLCLNKKDAPPALKSLL